MAVIGQCHSTVCVHDMHHKSDAILSCMIGMQPSSDSSMLGAYRPNPSPAGRNGLPHNALLAIDGQEDSFAKESAELPDSVIIALLKREHLLTRAKLNALYYEHITGERKLRSLKTQLRQVLVLFHAVYLLSQLYVALSAAHVRGPLASRAGIPAAGLCACLLAILLPCPSFISAKPLIDSATTLLILFCTNSCYNIYSHVVHQLLVSSMPHTRQTTQT